MDLESELKERTQAFELQSVTFQEKVNRTSPFPLSFSCWTQRLVALFLSHAHIQKACFILVLIGSLFYLLLFLFIIIVLSSVFGVLHMEASAAIIYVIFLGCGQLQILIYLRCYGRLRNLRTSWKVNETSKDICCFNKRFFPVLISTF